MNISPRSHIGHSLFEQVAQKPLPASLPDASPEISKLPRVLLKRRPEQRVVKADTSVAQESDISEQNWKSTTSTYKNEQCVAEDDDRPIVSFGVSDTDDPLPEHTGAISDPFQQQQRLRRLRTRALAKTECSRSDTATPHLVLESAKRSHQNPQRGYVTNLRKKVDKRAVHAERTKALPNEVHSANNQSNK